MVDCHHTAFCVHDNDRMRRRTLRCVRLFDALLRTASFRRGLLRGESLFFSAHLFNALDTRILMKSPTVIICPGNGCTNIRNINWYGRLFDLLTQKHGIQCVCENFPDPHRARRNIWVPHVRCVRLLYFNIYIFVIHPHTSKCEISSSYIVQFSRRSAWTK